MTDDAGENSFFGSLSVIAAISFCCIGLGAVAGGAALAGGAAGTTVAVGSATLRGTLISGLVTVATVAVVAVLANWYFR